MASIIKRKRKTKTTYLLFVRRKGVKAISKSFINKTDANKWARAVEEKIGYRGLLGLFGVVQTSS